MKIGNPSAGKSGVVGQGGPFKKLMSVNGEKGEKAPVLTAPPLLKRRLPDGVTPLTSASAKTVNAPLPVASGPLPANVKQLNAAAAQRQVARSEAHVKADNLVDLRAHSHEEQTKRYDTRLLDLICQELRVEFSNEPSRPQAANSDRQPIPAPVPSHPGATVTPITRASPRNEADLKAASAAALIEKIEAFVKSQRPGLALTLDGSLGARVEIERLGPKEVALRVIGKNGPPAPEDIGRIREEMRARGLKVGALSVA